MLLSLSPCRLLPLAVPLPHPISSVSLFPPSRLTVSFSPVSRLPISPSPSPQPQTRAGPHPQHLTPHLRPKLMPSTPVCLQSTHACAHHPTLHEGHRELATPCMDCHLRHSLCLGSRGLFGVTMMTLFILKHVKKERRDLAEVWNSTARRATPTEAPQLHSSVSHYWYFHLDTPCVLCVSPSSSLIGHSRVTS